LVGVEGLAGATDALVGTALLMTGLAAVGTFAGVALAGLA
jgi:hypothetical protein